jgi:O-antigen/teichoic acid export membrane protein
MTASRRAAPPAAPTSYRRPTIPILRRTTGAGSPGRGEVGGYRVLLSDSVIYGTGRALQKLLVALLLPLYTAFLTRGDYGILGMVVAVTTFLDVFVTLGFDVTFSRFYFADTTLAGRRKVVTNVFWVSTVYPALLLGACGLLLPYWAPLVLSGDYSAGDWRYFAVALLTLFFTNLNDIPFVLFRLEHKPWVFTAYTLARIVVQVPLSIVFVAVFKWGAMGVLLANLFTAVGLQVSLLPTYVRKLNLLPDRKVMRPMLAFAVPAMFTGISFYWLKFSDRFFLMRYQGIKEVGLYTVANALAQPLYLVLTAFRMAWPQWHYAKLDDPPEHRRIVARSSTYFLALNGLLLVLLGAFLPLISHVLLNERYWGVAGVTFVLTLSIALYAIYTVFWVGANVAMKNTMIPVFVLIASAVNVGLNFVFVPAYGMWAAAWTTVAGYAILAVTIYFYSERYYHIPFEWTRLVKMLGATVLSLAGVGAVMWATGLRTAMPLDELVWCTVATLPAVALFPLTLVLSGFFTSGERRRLRQAWGRVGGVRTPAPSLAEPESAEEEAADLEIEARLEMAEKDTLTP